MRIKNIFNLLIILLTSSFVLSACSDSKNTPDFTGIYRGFTEVKYYSLNAGTKVYIRPSATRDPYKVDLEVQTFQNNTPTAYNFTDLLIDSRSASNSYFKIKGQAKDVDFGKTYGVAKTVDIEGTREGKILELRFAANFEHKTEIIYGDFAGNLLNRKENTKAEIEKFSIDSPLVPNIVVHEDRKEFEVLIKKETPNDVIKTLKPIIRVSEGATFTQSSEYMDPVAPMVITVTSEDQSTTSTYTARVSYVAVSKR